MSVCGSVSTPDVEAKPRQATILFANYAWMVGTSKVGSAKTSLESVIRLVTQEFPLRGHYLRFC
jgi:hypothetical protein